MANRNKILMIGASSAEELEAKINKKLDLLNQYHVVTASSICSDAAITKRYILTTIVLELIVSAELE